ncbi:MAG: DUF2934 domain-containing protein [Candidatus Omnitrophica bacterium]|nr:DUF2934 domain-containing protein [Candidatus Omnitrophota bacterium]
MVVKKSVSGKVVSAAKKSVEPVKAVVKPVPAKVDVKVEVKPAVKKEAQAVVKKNVSQDDFWRRVENKAYEIYVSRGADHGDDQRDWFEAERQVRAELGM